MNGPTPPAPFPRGEGGIGRAPLLDVRHLAVRYGSIEALRGVTLSVMPGKFVAIVGPNGAGKSTHVNTIAGLLRPAGGTITFDGEPIDTLSPARVVCDTASPRCRKGGRSSAISRCGDNLHSALTAAFSARPSRGRLCADTRRAARHRRIANASTHSFRVLHDLRDPLHARSRAANSRCSRSGAP